MRAQLAKAVYFGRNGMEPILVLATIAALRLFGLSGDTPLWMIGTLLAVGAVWQQPAVQHRLSGGIHGGRLWARIGLHVLQTTAVMYMTGWGALLAVAHLHVFTLYLKEDGSRSWRPLAVSSAVSIALGELSFSYGILHGYLPRPQSHGISMLIALGTLTTARVLGQATRQRERAESALRASEERFRTLLRDGSDVITVSAADGTVTYVSQAIAQVMGYFPNDVTGRRLREYVHPDDLLADAELHERVLASDGAQEHTAELRYRHADDAWHWHEVILRNMLDNPQVAGVVGHHRDITERRAVQDRIAHAAAHDGLTGLANGPTLNRDLERALGQGTRYQHPVGMLFLDLDGFKLVNDTYGHDVGDRLLSTVADVVRRTVRDTDTVGRLGGDEFGVVLTRVGGADEAMSVAQRIIEGIEGNASVAGLKLDVGCSIGVALALPGGSDAKTLMRHADAAMYRSKRRARNGYQLYEEEDVTAPWLT
ncbi:diguanylate cyclase domain-containing protein [Actinoplanes sp. NPDC049265]|uniref:diguanylate cyclase domain-containing protein n=1 Tax=Actinoplanes sp. NPDC049265 TaxID=3363902 RepID=UPI0037100E0E